MAALKNTYITLKLGNGGGGSGSGVTPEEVQSQLDVLDEVVSQALVDLNDRVDEISGNTGGDLSNYWTSAQTQDAISAATSGKADAVNVQPNTNEAKFPFWNEQGIITSWSSVYGQYNHINGFDIGAYNWNGDYFTIYAPESAGTAGDILVSTGNGAPVWSADNKVSSTSVSTIWKGTQAEYDQLATKDPETFYIIINNSN